MTAATNKAIASSYFERVLNRGDMSAADDIFSPDIRFHYPLGELSGADAVKDYIQSFRTAFPDIRFTVADLIGEDDRIAARWSLAGTQTGAFRGRAPTNNKVSVAGITMMNFEDEKIAEMWIAFDPARLMNE